MKRLAFAISVLALGFVATTPARADFAVAKFESGFCRVWWDSGFKPWSGEFLWFKRHHHWHHWSYRTHTWEKSEHRLHRAVAHGRCRW
jgi:hypothetical protein